MKTFHGFAISNKALRHAMLAADVPGKTSLLWFDPKAMTTGCTTEARGLRDKDASLEDAGFVVFGVSFDDPALTDIAAGQPS